MPPSGWNRSNGRDTLTLTGLDKLEEPASLRTLRDHVLARLPRVDFPIGGFSPPEGRLARGFKPPAFSRFLFQSAVKSAESF